MPAMECRTRWAQTSVVNAILTRADVRLSDNERARVPIILVMLGGAALARSGSESTGLL